MIDLDDIRRRLIKASSIEQFNARIPHLIPTTLTGTNIVFYGWISAALARRVSPWPPWAPPMLPGEFTFGVNNDAYKACGLRPHLSAA